MIQLTGAIVMLVAKVTLILLLGTVVAALSRHKSAAVRHAIWAITLIGILLVPFLMTGIPGWRVPMLPPERTAIYDGAPAARPAHGVTPTAVPARVTELASMPPEHEQEVYPAKTTSNVPAPTSGAFVLRWLFRLWLLGAAFGLARLVIGHLGLRRVRALATPVNTAAWSAMLLEECIHAGVTRPVSLLASDTVGTPVTWGTRRPVILLPATAHAWTSAQQRVALRHELAHIARGDTLTQLWAALARVIYWFHPIVWFAAHRLRLEGEQACDERVVSLGTPPTEYAAQLLELARSVHRTALPVLISAAMARPSQLDRRLRAILSADRHTLDRRGALATGTVVALLAVSIAVLQPAARESVRLSRQPAGGAVPARRVPTEPEQSVRAPSRVPRTLVPAPLSASQSQDPVPDGESIGSSQPDPCEGAVLTPSRVILSIPDGNLSNGNNWVMTRITDRCTTTVRVKGPFKLTDDGKDFASLSPNSSFIVEDQYDGTSKKITIAADASGALSRTWSVNDSIRPYGDEARTRLASVLAGLSLRNGLPDRGPVIIGLADGTQVRLTDGSQDGTVRRQVESLQRQAEAMQRQAKELQGESGRRQVEVLQQQAEAMQRQVKELQDYINALSQQGLLWQQQTDTVPPKPSKP